MNQNNLAQQLQYAFQLLQQGQREQAEQIGRTLLAQYPNQPDVLNFLGQIEQGRHQFEKALRCYKKGLKSAPGHLQLLNNAGWMEKELENFMQAEKLFLKALKVDSRYFYARQNLAILYQEQRKFAKAKRLYLEVIRQQPNLADALANLSTILEKEHQLDEAKSYAGRAMEVNPNHRVARLTLANIATRNNAFEEVIRLLTPFLQLPQLHPMDRAVMAGKCAYAYQELGEYEAAFKLYQNANQLLYHHYEPGMRDPGMIYSPAAFRAIEAAIPDFNFSDVKNEIREPVFLIGFPRSGTTLLDQILFSHSQITVLEEKPNLVDAFTEFPATEQGLNALKNASEAKLRRLRSSYWANVKRETGANKLSPIVVDKLPLNVFALLHINKIFPGAKIIVALRDPRDCVFSSYQQKFGMNAAMFQMLKLHTAAVFYDQVMNIIMGIDAAQAFSMHFIKYEEVIKNFRREVQRLVDFLDLEWEDSLLEYQATAKTRDVTTPSASQVIQPLYASSIGKWKHYRSWIGDSFEPLEKWVEMWGYPASQISDSGVGHSRI
ncbi:MAG: tetratricopeptide repeat protein [Xanthomonadales bacterium]|nr:sulfotransferase [Gammaproteobacteria bacterium]MBT8052337.1 sulfotransferase [Gammaproteobacteria bacterium]NND56553.1 tetratricopeptide repeat protein [Xanthomonadales bacterium]NNK52548.1 tetratricopeptide repeat protein [Xanthomonadales bacterium]